MNEDLRYILALISIKGIGSIRARHLIEAFGSAKGVFEADAQMIANIPSISQALLEGRKDNALMDRIDHELKFIESHHIKPLIYGAENYPKRLLECPDAPSLLFQLGNTDLETNHIVSIVGTRNCTQYGRDMVHRFVSELKEAIPEVIIVSGLALGIDVESHKASLENLIPTVGVVAHGLDRIYPTPHRNIAKQMIMQGGSIVTEYLSGTTPERCNYLIFNNFSFLSTSFFCKIPSLFIIKIIGQFGHIKKSIVNFCKKFQFFSLFSKNVPIWCPFTLPISL